MIYFFDIYKNRKMKIQRFIVPTINTLFQQFNNSEPLFVLTGYQKNCLVGQ